MTTEHPHDESLRWQLRGLRHDVPPARDLWPDIASRIAASPQSPLRPLETVDRAEPLARVQRRWMPWATAASMLLAVGFIWQSGAFRQPAPEPLLQREASALTRDYEGALAQMPTTSLPPEIASALDDLDRSAEQIRSALDVQPDARFLLNQLRRTYARRLALTQRVAMT